MAKRTLIFTLLICCLSPCFALKTVNLILDWYPNPDQAPLFVGKAKGYFKAQGISLKIHTPSDPSAGPKLVASNKAQLAIDYEPSLIYAISEGLPITRIASLIKQPLAALAVLKDSNIKTAQQLKGKSIAYSAYGSNSVILKAMLAHVGLKPNDVKLVDVQYNLVQALLAHRVDAIFGIMRNVEPVEIKRLGQQVRLFYPEKLGVPSYQELVLIANTKSAKKVWVKKFNKALVQAINFIQQHPKQAWQLFIKENPSLNTAMNKAIWKRTYPLFSLNPTAFNRRHYNAFVNFLAKKNFIKTIPPAERYSIHS